MPDDLGPGSRVGGYRIRASLGKGGMGSVWRAVDENLGREVALKVLPDELAELAELRQRFLRESKAAARVDHPNIIPIYAADESDGRLFIAMRYVNGGDVGRLLRRERRLRPARALAIAAAVANALDATHAAGLVHGDVKPANMLLHVLRSGDEPHVYLADFGLAWFPSDRAASSGVTAGTFGYMAPETMRGEPTSDRADQWALACSAFVMLGGRHPFLGLSGNALQAALNGPPPALTVRHPELPAAVDAVLARGLAHEPDRRFATCLEFADALADALAQVLVPGVRVSVLPPPAAVEIPLRPDFRYVHEPFREDSAPLRSLGNDHLVADLESRIRYSAGGAFLITGFRGVGKTSLVIRALDRLAVACAPAELVVPVFINAARDTTTENLLVTIIRGVYEELKERELLERLPSQTQQVLREGYQRTKVTITETWSVNRQSSVGITLGHPAGSSTLGATRGNSKTVEDQFLPYSESDAEHALTRIVKLIGGQPVPVPRKRSRLGRPGARRTGTRGTDMQSAGTEGPRLRLVVVIDEVDKLTADAAGMAATEALLAGTRNVLTMPGAHFLFVAGPDLHDRAVRDRQRGTGILQSVFGWQPYVPCVWDAPRRLIDDITDGEADADTALGGTDTLADYLSFKARGIPRLLLQQVNEHATRAGDDRPRLLIPAQRRGEIEFYARLERIVGRFVGEESQRRGRLREPLAEDRVRLGSYYIVDAVLASEGLPFTATKLLQDEGEAQFDPLLGVSRRSIDALLDHLARSGILQVVRGDRDPGATVIGDVAGAADKVFQLSGPTLDELYGRTPQPEAGHESMLDALLPGPEAEPEPEPAANPDGEDYEDLDIPSAESGWEDVDTSPIRVAKTAAPLASAPREPAGGRLDVGGRYRLELPALSHGALSSTYKGHEIRTGRQVSVKLLRQELAGDDVARARFRREAAVLGRLAHPQVVGLLGTVDKPGTFAIVMERLLGPTLEQRVRDEGPMPADEVAATGQVLAGALQYIAGERVVRLDLKPANITMADRGPVIAGLGIAFDLDTGTGSARIGTPAFMSPEQVTGDALDPRSDIYSLGLCLYFCLTGETPWQHLPSMAAVLDAIAHERVDTARLPASAGLRTVLARATALSRDDRFPDAGTLRQALLATPEWHSVSGD